MRPAWPLFLLAAVLASSCDDKGADSVGPDKDTDTDSSDGGAALDCATVPPATCVEEAESCAVIVGLPIKEDGAGGYCVDTGAGPRPVGCRDIDATCGAVPTWASPPADPAACHAFQSRCVPNAWKPCGDSAMEVSTPCPS